MCGFVYFDGFIVGFYFIYILLFSLCWKFSGYVMYVVIIMVVEVKIEFFCGCILCVGFVVFDIVNMCEWYLNEDEDVRVIL